MTEPQTEPAGALEAAFGYIGWKSFVTWAHEDVGMRAAFTAETGMTFPDKPGSAGALSSLIDDATGYTAQRTEAFVIWASEQYGEEFSPPLMRQAIAQKRGATPHA